MRKKVYLSNNVLQAFIYIVLVVVVGIVLYVKHGQKAGGPVSRPEIDAAEAVHPGQQVNHRSSAKTTDGSLEKPLPLLLDLGATKCIPCKMMAPILEELREEYQGRFDVVFIDVWENKEAISRYNIRVIPTQIFFDAAGNEVSRHEGFLPKEEIVKTFQQLGVR